MPYTFRTYDLAVAFYRNCKKVQLPSYLRNQVCRAASSVALNLREGAAKTSMLERRRFYRIAFASLKECQAIFDLEPNQQLSQESDRLGAHIYCLIRSLSQ